MKLPGTPMGTQNEPKSAKTLPKTPPKRICKPSPKKVASQSMPETAPCASRKVNTLLLALPTKCLQAQFWLHSGSIWGAYWTPWVPKGRPSAEKSAFQKHMKKRLQKTWPKVTKMTSEMDTHFLYFLLFWPHWMYLGPGWVLGPVLGQFVTKL